MVRGITVRSRSVAGNIGAALQTIVGGNITILTELCEKTREESFILCMRYDATEVMSEVTEVPAYGTAVVV